MNCPILHISRSDKCSDRAALADFVDSILWATRAGDVATVQRLEQAIDTHVFRLYALIPNEVKMVSDSTAK